MAKASPYPESGNGAVHGGDRRQRRRRDMYQPRVEGAKRPEPWVWSFVRRPAPTGRHHYPIDLPHRNTARARSCRPVGARLGRHHYPIDLPHRNTARARSCRPVGARSGRHHYPIDLPHRPGPATTGPGPAGDVVWRRWHISRGRRKPRRERPAHGSAAPRGPTSGTGCERHRSH